MGHTLQSLEYPIANGLSSLADDQMLLSLSFFSFFRAGCGNTCWTSDTFASQKCEEYTGYSVHTSLFHGPS
ncbi:hypothetical protein CPSG_03789 [Coccidioides posadasii str. Silveira]|uniref:Uncharacterized protein n=1 Tax=Coccidioides posadasii (strain RMSCC 757 / Silveira) TaxID=443226 RepID=E9D2J1_COCPS|nr:hypothetical protein CPSG_03789 [Coccidioides posadasii str. Silveira]